MPAIGQPVQGYYYDQTTDTLRPIAAEASTVDLPGRHRYAVTPPPDLVDGQLWLDSDAPYVPYVSGTPTFATVAERDSLWTSPPNGAQCVTLDTYTVWLRTSTGWGPISGAIPAAILWTTGTTITNTTWTPLGWSGATVLRFLTYAGSGVTIQYPGLYRLSGLAQWSAGTGPRIMKFTNQSGYELAGAGTQDPLGYGTQQINTTVTQLSAGDVVKLEVYQSSGGSLTLLGANGNGLYTSMQVIWEGRA